MRTLGVLEVEEYLLMERFDTKYLHQVSYLRDEYGVGVLQGVVGVCSSYCCPSSTTCVPVIVQYITTSLILLSTSYNVS